MVGRIQTFIAIKASQSSQLSSILANTQAQITAIKVQIANYTAAITNLGIPGLQNQLNNILNNLQVAYNAYNAGNIDLTSYNLNITANIQSINNLTSQKQATVSQLASDNQSLNATNTLIASLQQQLAAAQQNKNVLSARILQETGNVTVFTQQIDFLNAQNVNLNN
jgi:chromosome segregation ATPase